MPDITMCKGGDCPRKETCYRYKAKPNDFRQTYFMSPPYTSLGDCSYYWKDTKPGAKKDL